MSAPIPFTLNLDYAGGTVVVPQITGGTAPYTYNWSEPSVSSATISTASTLTVSEIDPNPHTYELVLRDSNSPPQQISNTITLTGGTPADSPAVSGIEIYYDSNNNDVVVAVTGFTAPYNYVWSTPYGSITYNNITPPTTNVSPLKDGIFVFGTYSVQVTDSSSPQLVSDATLFLAPPAPSIQFRNTVTNELYPNQSIIVFAPPAPLSLTIEVAEPTSTALITPIKTNWYKSIFLHASDKPPKPFIIRKPGFYSVKAYLPDGTTVAADIAASI
jgi:hypothetical protein